MDFVASTRVSGDTLASDGRAARRGCHGCALCRLRVPLGAPPSATSCARGTASARWSRGVAASPRARAASQTTRVTRAEGMGSLATRRRPEAVFRPTTSARRASRRPRAVTGTEREARPRPPRPPRPPRAVIPSQRRRPMTARRPAGAAAPPPMPREPSRSCQMCGGPCSTSEDCLGLCIETQNVWGDPLGRYCSQDCSSPQFECPDPGTGAEPRCVLLFADGQPFDACLLDCSDTGTAGCPEGMICLGQGMPEVGVPRCGFPPS